MRSNHAPRPLLRHGAVTAAILGFLLLGASSAMAQAPEETRRQALELYDQGRYDDALPLLEALDTAGEADGSLLYRLYFCLRSGNDPAARQMLDRAKILLEEEIPDAANLEPSFYLANAYRNVGKLSDASAVAARATARVENGEIASPESGVEMFRLGKLYADQERVAEASEWYARAVEALNGDERSAAAKPYVNWAGRYLAERAWNAGDYDQAATYLATLEAAGLATVQDLDQLAVASCRAGRYADARSAWQGAERAKPTDANRPRYCWRLADQAEKIAPLPALAPDQRPWEELSKEELEALLIEQVQVARDAIAEAGDGTTLKKKQRRKLQERIDQARAYFVTGALEYALRGHNIREVAFFNGFAPMIFHDKQWELPQV